LLGWMREKVLAANNLVQEDVDSIHLVDEPEKVRDIVVAFHENALRSKNDEDKRLAAVAKSD
jgi:hypothetical protein